MYCNRTTPKPTSSAIKIGRIVENNLSNFITLTAGEIRRSDTVGEDVYQLLAVGFDLLKARGVVRDRLRRLELQQWGARA